MLARHQALRELEDEHAADALMRSHRLEPLDPPVRGVRRLCGSGRAPEQRAFAVALRARPDATVTGPLALALLRVPGFDTDSPFEVLLRPGRRLRGVDVRSRVVPDPDRAVTLERLLQAGGGLEVESEGERRLAPVLDCFDPRPDRQVWVRRGRRVDFCFRPLRLAYEYLGAIDHTAVEDRLADDRRDEDLRRAGLRVQYVTAEDLRDPVARLGQVAGVLAVRAHEVGVSAPVLARALDR